MVAAPKVTPLYDVHVAAGARMIDFAGWQMPVQYTGILEESRAVRHAAGLFDLCHMGEIRIAGPRALAFVQRLTTNDASKLAVGQAQYTLLCNERGGVLDDLLVYRLEDAYFLVVNAANADKDYQWLLDHRIDGCAIENVSLGTGLLALQGPLAEAMLQPLADVDLPSIPYYHCRRGVVYGIPCTISRTGYTGEDGFELFCAWNDTARLWHALSTIHNPPQFCGLGARDTLRLEAAMALYGHELDETTNPFEAGLGWTVKLNKPEFIGRDALLAVKRDGPRRRLVGIEILGRAIARNGFPVVSNGQPGSDLGMKTDRGQQIGYITSGTFSPTLEKSIALAYVPSNMAQNGAEFHVDVRGRTVAARAVSIPFYKRKEESK